MEGHKEDAKWAKGSVYNFKVLSAPVLSGWPLYIGARVTSIGLVQKILASNNQVYKLRNLGLPVNPTYYPFIFPEGDVNTPNVNQSDALASLASSPTYGLSSDRPPTTLDYHNAYKNKTTTPTEVAKNLIASIKRSQSGPQPMNIMIAWDEGDILRQAEASTKRFAEGKPLSVFDGVPVGVKDEIDMLPYPTTAGTSAAMHTPTQDATVVKKLREAGALLFGKTNMVEIGVGTMGENVHYGWPRNPYNWNYSCSGSSNGSAAAVASGLCPIALGCDGGGSIRLPASVCGLVGLKCTFGRVSEGGVFPLCPTVGHCGPIAATVHDAALTYSLLAGPDPADPHSLHQPKVTFPVFDKEQLRGKRVGVFWDWFEDAQQDVVDVCRESLDRLIESTGMTLVEIEIPMLDELKTAHMITILSEMRHCITPQIETRWNTLSPYTRVTMNLCSAFGSQDYVAAQNVRSFAIQTVKDVFSKCDFVVTPTSAVDPPAISRTASTSGLLDGMTTSQLMKYAILANMTGAPAISVPAGYSKANLPVGIQFMGPWWSEAVLLQVARAVEESTARRQPTIFYPPPISALPAAL
eukprot:comp23847_c0_seq1/m.41662 comp23847_c0_seq1/g.41662  ORF comp23847_c0_seq1/g.41662 comp23847_c0_seq1/m.41662 type:complete len:580 (-) comp23847_c0_seq1:231-1970(-)